MTTLASAADPGSLWQWHPHLDVWLLVAILVGGYLYAIRRLGPSHAPGGGELVSRRQAICYFSGVVMLWIGADWPIHDVAEGYLFSVHMVQHMIFSFIAAPLLLMGTPAWLLRLALRPRWLLNAVRSLTRPLAAFLLFNAVIAVTHWPALVNQSVQSELLHFTLHSILFVASVLMWWPVVDPLPETRRLSQPGKMLYLFAQSILPTVPASFLTFGDHPIYSFYAHAPRLWLDAVTDQRIAGLLMKLGGGLLLWAVIGVIFFRWHALEETGGGDGSLTWDDFEHELKAWDLRRT